jgi:transposase
MSATDPCNSFWLGIDVAKLTFDAAVAPVGTAPSDWARLKVGHFEMSEEGIRALALWLEPFLGKGSCVGVCLESTGSYSRRCATLLAAMELPAASIVNPALPLAFRKSFGLRDKCDRVDAAVLALYGTVHRPKQNTAQATQYQRLKDMWRLHEDFSADIRAWKNRLEQCLDKELAAHIEGAIEGLEQQRKLVWSGIECWVEDHAELKDDAALLCSIPGIGKKTSYMALAELGDLRTWKREEIISYAGLFPKQHSSGTSVAKNPRLVRGGGARIRKALFLPCCSLTRLDTPMTQWRQTLLQRGKSKMSTVVALMRKVLLLMRAVVITGQAYDPDKISCHTT